MLILPLAIVIAILVWYITTNNDFKSSGIKIEEAKSGIEIALTKRYDMLTKLRDVAKSYAKHEQELYADVIRLRRGMSISEMNTAARRMDEAFDRINVTAEAYPELRSSALFSDVQAGIRDAEEHLQAARRVYNSNVTRFNTMREVFPSNLIGKKYPKYEFFEAEEVKKSDVNMNF